MPRKKKTEENTPIFDAILETKIVDTSKFTIKKWLTTAEQLKFCSLISNQVTCKNTYSPALFDVMRRYATVLYFTDIALPNSGNALDVISTVLYETNIIKEIFSVIDMTLYDELVRAARAEIAHVISQRADFTQRVAKLESDIIELRDQYESICGNVEAINEYVATQFEGVDMQEVAASLTDVANKFRSLTNSELVGTIRE